MANYVCMYVCVLLVSATLNTFASKVGYVPRKKRKKKKELEIVTIS